MQLLFLVMELIIKFLIRPALVLDRLMPGLLMTQFALVSTVEEKVGWVAAVTLEGKHILRRNLSIWRAEAMRLSTLLWCPRTQVSVPVIPPLRCWM